eukprot:s708_g23.t1
MRLHYLDQVHFRWFWRWATLSRPQEGVLHGDAKDSLGGHRSATCPKHLRSPVLCVQVLIPSLGLATTQA